MILAAGATVQAGDVMAGRTDVERALVAWGAVAMTLLSMFEMTCYIELELMS